jgi:hypothetical protein
METLFGPAPVNSSEPIDQTVIDFILWLPVYLNSYVQINDNAASLSVLNNFRALITLPLLWLQPNGISFNVSSTFSKSLVTGLPPSMTVTAIFAEGKTYLSIAPWTAIVYIAVSCVFLCIVAGVLFVTMSIQSPKTSPFAILDFSSRALAGGTSHRSVSRRLMEVSTFDSNDEIKNQFESTRVVLRGLPVKEGGEEVKDEVIGFTMDHTQGTRLRRGAQYVTGALYEEEV